MKIAIVGTGYVGLVTAAVFAKLGHRVSAVDIDEKKIKALKANKIPFFEPGLKAIVSEGVKKSYLKFTTSYKEALGGAQAVFICVGTPSKANGGYDLSFVFSAAKEIAKALKSYSVIVIKSTVPPGTTAQIREIIQNNTHISFDLASCPEFLREGSAVEDSFHPARIVIGTESEKAKSLLLKIHQAIEAPRVICDIKSAQLIKYAANAFLATKISFINAIAILCDKIGADILKVEEGLGLDPRIGKSFLQAGLGYGGSCFPKDIQALIVFAKRQGYDFDFLKQVELINKHQIDYLISKLRKVFGGELKGRRLTILGLSFKPQTDDLRESRAILLIKELKKERVKIKAHDPVAVPQIKKLAKVLNIKCYKNVYESIKNSDVLILVTEWPIYRKLDFVKVKKLMRQPILIDGRNFLEKEKLKKIGFIYEGIGSR